jgi:hypothetical protein
LFAAHKSCTYSFLDPVLGITQEKTMKINMLIAAPLLAAMFAAPASATSLAKAQKLCEAAAAAQTPAPKSVRVDRKDLRSTDAMVWVTLKVTPAEGDARKVQCTVDRDAAVATLQAS